MIEELIEILKEIHEMSKRKNPEINRLKIKAVEIVKRGDIPYIVVYEAMLAYSENKKEFHSIMWDLRPYLV